MKNIRLIAFVVASLVCLTLLIYPLGDKKNNAAQSQKEMLVVVERVPGQTKITPEMVQVKKFNEEVAVEGAISEIAQAVGKVATTTLYPGEIILPEKIADPHSQSAGLAASLQANSRAFTLEVQLESGMAGLLQVGNFVDVLGVLERPDTPTKEKQSVAVVQSKQVVALDRKISNKEETGQEEIVYTAVTLAVLPEDTLKLALADEAGPLRLVLRPQEDKNNVALPPVLIQNLFAP